MLRAVALTSSFLIFIVNPGLRDYSISRGSIEQGKITSQRIDLVFEHNKSAAALDKAVNTYAIDNIDGRLTIFGAW